MHAKENIIFMPTFFCKYRGPGSEGNHQKPVDNFIQRY